MSKKINLDKENINKEDIYINTTIRPDITVMFRPSGSYIIRDGKLVPNLDDEAMMKREEQKIKNEILKENNEVNNGKG